MNKFKLGQKVRLPTRKTNGAKFKNQKFQSHLKDSKFNYSTIHYIGNNYYLVYIRTNSLDESWDFNEEDLEEYLAISSYSIF